MPGGHARFIGRETAGVKAVRAAVRDQLAAGAEVIKVIASGGVLTPGTSPDDAQMTVEELRAAVDEAGRQGRRVAAHAHGATGMKNALRAGVHSIEHATLMDDEARAMMKRQDVYMVPTLSALATTARGLRADYARHVRIARWTLPIWLYVSVTGVVIYLMLYRMY